MDWTIFVILTVAAISGIALAPLLIRRDILMAISVSFATGTLLAIILGHVIPETLIQNNHDIPYYLVTGFIVMMICNHYIFENDPCCDHDGDHGHAGDTDEGHNHKLGLATIGAMTVCTVNDGILLGHQAELTLNTPLLWAMVGHKLTAAFGLYTMVKVCVSKKSKLSAFFLFLFVVLTPVVYAITSSNVLEISTVVMDRILALSAGIVLYVISVNLIPRCNELGHKFPKAVIIALIMGIVSTFYFVEIGHDENSHEKHDHGQDSIKDPHKNK
jgi:zinc transporter ZupT